ncbi:MAG: 3-dehydroquinate synthase [Planctomycetota bacterium]|nr:3-dehydroquinate synthase [Planctomycetota bacterium]
MRKLVVKLESGQGYPIHLGRGVLRRLPSSLRSRPVGERYAVITDHTVRDLYGETVLAGLERAGLHARIFSFAPGEARKNLRTVESIAGRMLKAGISRSDAVIALGGGVVGDVAGYVAASYMRGIPYIQAPTTLLSMVDSSIGGKVAVDLDSAKNIIGHFWHPSRVFIDPTCLDTLPVRQQRSGWAEIVKHGVIADRDYFGWLEKNAARLLRLRGKAMEDVLARSLSIKSRIVAKDAREADLRMVLNYGHTIGHAIESLTRYRKYTHGEAVAIGMNLEGRLALLLGLWDQADLDRQNRLLRRLRLPTRLPDLSASKIIRSIRHDKKSSNGLPVFALPRRIGAMATRDGRFGLHVDPALIKGTLT